MKIIIFEGRPAECRLPDWIEHISVSLRMENEAHLFQRS
jgi:hypothetical protein